MATDPDRIQTADSTREGGFVWQDRRRILLPWLSEGFQRTGYDGLFRKVGLPMDSSRFSFNGNHGSQ